MAWIELSIDTTPEAVDWVSTLLGTLKYEGDIQITKQTEPEQGSTDQNEETGSTFTIYLYLPYSIHTNRQIEEIVNRLSPLQRTGLVTNFQTNLVDEAVALDLPIHRIGKRFVVLTPDTAYQPELADEILLRLKKTFAFGSGLHPATILSLQLLERHVVLKMNVLDLGSGSGILSVATAKLGASVLALDNDPIAVQATQDAVRRNGVEQQVTVVEGSLGSGSELGHWMGGNNIANVPIIQAIGSFDLIVSNILARIHIALAHDFRRALRQTATSARLLITAGFTTDYENEVSTALQEAGFEAIDRECSEEWVALAYRLKT
jgi:ribosomal protein L11 methyltransferase